MDYGWKKHTKEYLLYALLLGIAFLYPFLHIGKEVLDGATFQWSYVWQQWSEIIPFAVLLLVHIFVLLPILFDKKHRHRYILWVLMLIGVFFIYMNYQHYNRMPSKSVPIPEPPHPVMSLDFDFPWEEPPAPPMPQKRSVPGPVIMDTIIAFLLIGCSLAIKLMFKHYEDSQRMEELEKAQLRQELDQLKAQIRPHFLMNSLNNIHGMVEIDAAKAQDMILELSGMMRYVLYESSTTMIALSDEIDFLNNYISLMRVRYNTDKVAIECSFPDKDSVKSICIPPLLLIIFIENAFKHGINYQEHSYINLNISIDKNMLTLYCANSLHQNTSSNETGGLGLDNIRKRLDILYADEYSLESCKLSNKFIIILTIPTGNGNQMHSNR